MSDYPEITIIVGSGRSGTSYLQDTLRDTLDIGFFRESKYIIPTYRKLFLFGNLSNKDNLQRLVRFILKEGTFERLSKVKNISSVYNDIFPKISEPTYSGVLYTIYKYIAERQGKTRLGYKFPADVVHIPELAKIFPSARFIHLLRDGRDVAISLLKQHWGAENLFVGSRFWSLQTHQGREAGSNLPGGRYIEVRYEDLIQDPDEVAFNLGNFLNLGQNMEQVESFIEQIKKTRKVEGVYGWKSKLSEKQVFLCEAASSMELSANGYELIYGGNAKISPFSAGYYLSIDFVSRVFRNLREFTNKKVFSNYS